ncbi:DNA replication licensing factor mcm6 [Physcia stellaris]|nr:DNA replication licensing factor mcm6 [Physcia stellaris]
MDSPLSTLDQGQDEEYEDLFGTQITPDTAGREMPNDDNMLLATQSDDVIARIPNSQSRSLSNRLCGQAPRSARLQLLESEDIIDVEDHASDIGDVPAFIKPKDEVDMAEHQHPDAIIKQEDMVSPIGILGRFSTDDVIDLCQSDDDEDVIEAAEVVKVHVKAETTDTPFLWNNMGADVIDIPDSDQEEQSLSSTPVPSSSKTTGSCGFTAGSSPISDSVNSQKLAPATKRSTLESEKLPQAGRPSSARHDLNAITTGAGAIFRGNPSQRVEPDRSGIISSPAVHLDGDAVEAFRNMRKEYITKKKAGKTSEEDDILFMTAEKKEKARCKKMMAEYLRDNGLTDSEDDEDEAVVDDDEHLLTPQFSRFGSPAKRRRASRDEVESSGEASGDEDEPSPDKRSKTNQRDNKAFMRAFEVELHHNLMAGCEKMIYDQLKKEEQEAKKIEKATEKGHQQKKKEKVKKASAASKATSKVKKASAAKKAKAKAKARKPNPYRAGYLNDLSSLLSHNVYSDANANLSKRKLAVTDATRKKDALAGLLAGIDNEDIALARQEKNHIDRSTRVLGIRKVRPDGKGQWKLKGMISSLHHYQVQGAAWMKERETGDIQPKGGLVADEMGLGKTVQTIAAMVANRPDSGGGTRCTLIVAAPALVTQWISELEKHVQSDLFPIIIRHSASTRVGGPSTLTVLQQADIVLTTYQELVSSYPKCEPPPEIETLEDKKQWWHHLWDKDRGPLHRVFFHRIILDEAQAIKNHMSQTSIACRAVMARHRWALSGTPIQNKVSELYPYFRYLRVEHAGSFDVFKKNFCIQNNDDCTERLHAYLRQFMIRRTHATHLMGAPLLTLPENRQRTVDVEFSEVERTLYNAVRDRFIGDVNSFSKSGILEARSPRVLNMLLRLRQLTAHPFLIQDVIQDLFTIEDIEKLWTISAPDSGETQKRGKEMYSTMKRMIEDKGQILEDDQDASDKPSTSEIGSAEIQDESTLVLRFRKYLRNLNKSKQWTELKERSLCHMCDMPPDEPYVTDCFHLYCKECLSHMAYEASKREETSTMCLVCHTAFSKSQPCNGIEEIEMENISPLGSSLAQNRPRRRKHQNDAVRWLDLEGDVLQSSKTMAVQIQLESWLNEGPGEKIIVFSQFYLLMRIVARICEQRHWGFCNYNGSMSHEARDESLAMFRDDTDKQILIASMKCGGVGLNLTMASKVICVDLWWNSCVEQQAFCRVFRIGQEKETHITRFMVKDTIDERLIEMQKEKEQAIGRAIDDKKMLKQLPMPDLMRLFGPVREDSDGCPFILVDDDELGTIVPDKDKQEQLLSNKAAKKTRKSSKKGKVTKTSRQAKEPEQEPDQEPEQDPSSLPVIDPFADDPDSLFLP